MDHTAGRISITPTVARQTPKTDFGQLLNNSIKGVLHAGGLVGSMTGMPIVSSAVSAVSSLVSSGAAATGNINLGGSSGSIGTIASGGSNSIANSGGGIVVGSTVPGAGMGRSTQGTAGVEPAGMNDMLSNMRAEADRSMMMQLQMQNESREYNTLTNVLKLRHDSAKAAINNIR